MMQVKEIKVEVKIPSKQENHLFRKRKVNKAYKKTRYMPGLLLLLILALVIHDKPPLQRSIVHQLNHFVLFHH